MSTISYKNIDIDNIKLSNPEKLDNYYICNIDYDENLLYIQTPILNINEITNEYIILNITDTLSKFLKELEENNIKTTFNNCKEWFKKDIPYNAIDDMYKNIDLDNNKLKIDFPYIKEKLQCKIFNDNKEYINHNELNKNDNIILIFHIRGLKILKESFYLDFYINQIKLIKTNEYKILDEYSIIDDEELYNFMDELIFDEEINNVIKEDKLKKEREKLKKKKEKELKKKMEELKNELNELNN